MNLFYSIFLFYLLSLCSSSTIDATRDWSLSRIHPRYPPRRPPPPFDLPGVLRPSRPAFEAPTTPKPTPIVLYKQNCNPCWPGWGVKSMCNSTSDTKCEPCPLGTWSARNHHYRPCTVCSKCGLGLYEEKTCVSTRDTHCDSCSNTKAKLNEDFIRKCDWRKLSDARDLDLDDARFDPESKEEFAEFGSNEDDMDRFLLTEVAHPEHEEDIHLDDPEIDLEQKQPAKKPVIDDATFLDRPRPITEESVLRQEHVDEEEDEEDMSKEEEDAIARIMAMRLEARKKIAQISRRLEKPIEEPEIEAVDDNEDDVDFDIRRRILHPIRPLPQMMPGPERTINVEPEDDIVRPNEPPNFPPSYHNYPIDSLAHAGEGQRRKAIVLLILTCAIVVSTIAFVACYVKEYCRRRTAAYNRVLVVNLTPEEREIVRQSARVLDDMDTPKKRYKNDRGYSPVIDPESCICVTENPLEAYLNSADDRRVDREPLVENEILDEEPKVHRHA